jgi:Helix-turn-helix domain
MTPASKAMILTYRYRLMPSKSQHQALVGLLDAQRVLYNAALEERIDYYRKSGKGVSYIDQCKSLTLCRRDLPEMGALPANLQRWTLKRLDDAFQGFFRRIKARDGKAGFPRFRGKGWWDSFGFAEFSGIRLDGARLRFSGMPSENCAVASARSVDANEDRTDDAKPKLRSAECIRKSPIRARHGCINSQRLLSTAPI